MVDLNEIEYENYLNALTQENLIKHLAQRLNRGDKLFEQMLSTNEKLTYFFENDTFCENRHKVIEKRRIKEGANTFITIGRVLSTASQVFAPVGVFLLFMIQFFKQ